MTACFLGLPAGGFLPSSCIPVQPFSRSAVHPFTRSPAHLPTCLPAYLPTCLPAYLPICLPVAHFTSPQFRWISLGMPEQDRGLMRLLPSLNVTNRKRAVQKINRTKALGKRDHKSYKDMIARDILSSTQNWQANPVSRSSLSGALFFTEPNCYGTTNFLRVACVSRRNLLLKECACEHASSRPLLFMRVRKLSV